MHAFGGVGVALVTPFNKDFSIDFQALSQLVDHVIGGGVDYLIVLGTTGESPALQKEEKAAILRHVVAHAAGRVPVVFGLGGNNTGEVLDLLQTCDLSGVTGLLSVVPYYNKPTQEGIYQHFTAIAQKSPLPIILYNVPGRTVTNMTAATTLRLANDHSNIVAVKEASGNMGQCMDLVAGAPEHFAVLSGDDDLVLPQIAIGMHGVISVAANCYTRDFTDMVKQALAGEFKEARSVHYRLINKIRMLFAEGNPAGVKAVLHQMGVCDNVLRLPLVPATEELYAALVKA